MSPAHTAMTPCRHVPSRATWQPSTGYTSRLWSQESCWTNVQEQRYDGKLQCPVDGCLGVLKDGWNMRRHFRDLHFWDKVNVKKEGRSYP